MVPLSATVQYRWKTIKTGNWDLVKGDQDNLIEVKIIVIKEKKFWTLTYDCPILGDRLM